MLPSHRRQDLENIEGRLCRDESELDNTGHIPPYLDVSFLHSKRKYHVALRRVITAGLLRPVRHRKVRSRRLSSPRETTDNTSELSRCGPPEGPSSAECIWAEDRFVVELLYARGIPDALSQQFCMPSLSPSQARDLGLSFNGDRSRFPEHAPVLPALCVVPMR